VPTSSTIVSSGPTRAKGTGDRRNSMSPSVLVRLFPHPAALAARILGQR
jgi:hypothetical protein